MEPKQNRSIGLIIRRFFAIFILFSTASGIVAQIETGTFTNETFGSAFVSLLIAYYLARSPRNKTQSSKMDVKGNNDELGDEIQMEELLDEFEWVRKSTSALFSSLNTDHVTRSGVASDNAIDVVSLGYIIVGHLIHHVRIMDDRYHR